MINKRHEERIRDQVAKNREASDKQIKNTERIIDLVKRSKENIEDNIAHKTAEERSHRKD